MFVQYTIKTRVCECEYKTTTTTTVFHFCRLAAGIQIFCCCCYCYFRPTVVIYMYANFSLSRFSLCLSLRYAMQALLTASTDNAQKPIANRVYVIAKPLCRLIKQRRRSGNTSAWQFFLVVGKRVVNGVTWFHIVWPLCVSASGLAGSAAATKLQFPARFVYNLITYCRVLSFFPLCCLYRCL